VYADIFFVLLQEDETQPVFMRENSSRYNPAPRQVGSAKHTSVLGEPFFIKRIMLCSLLTTTPIARATQHGPQDFLQQFFRDAATIFQVPSAAPEQLMAQVRGRVPQAHGARRRDAWSRACGCDAGIKAMQDKMLAAAFQCFHFSARGDRPLRESRLKPGSILVRRR
jgi:hypothetical protein